MSDAMQLLSQVVAGARSTDRKYRWPELLAAMEDIVSAPPDQERERLLLAILRFAERVPLDSTSELPHSMSAEEMLKSFAVQALGKWTGTSYLSEMQRVRVSARSPILSAIARKVMQQVIAAEPIPLIASEGGMTFLIDQPPRRRLSPRQLDSPLQAWPNGGPENSWPPYQEGLACATV